MNEVDPILFVPLVIIAVTQIIKMFVPMVNGAVTIIVALAVGVVLALLDTHIGVKDFSIAAGVIYGLGAVGVTVTAAKAGGGASGDNTVATKARR